MKKNVISDYPYLHDLDSIPRLSAVNAAYLEEWIQRCRANGTKLSSINIHTFRMIQWLRDIGNDDAKTISELEIIRAYNSRLDRVNSGEYSLATLQSDVMTLRFFFKWLVGEEEAKKRANIKCPKNRTRRNLNEYVTREQVLKMRNYAESRGDIRGAALIMLLYGTGARRGEICAANVRDVVITRTHATIKLNGKTGVRCSPFVVSLPELQAWINVHPCRLPDGSVDPDAPLFVTYGTRGNKCTRLGETRVSLYVRSVATAVGVPLNVRASPHALRHLSATENARNFTAAEMELYYGWSKGSTSPSTYVHTSSEQLLDTVLRENGIEQEEKPAETQMIIQCPRCGHINKSGAKYCDQCSLILDNSLSPLYSEVVSDLNDPDVIWAVIKARQERQALKHD